MESPTESLLEFPCDFALKVMGRSEAAFEQLVIDIVRRHAGELDDDAIQTRPSRNGRYVSLTVTIKARDQAQLDALYRDLSAEEQVLFAL